MNHASLLEQLPPDARDALAAVRGITSELDVPAHVVGGVVRDLLLGRTDSVWDIDIVVEGDASRVADALAPALGGRITKRSQFGTFQLKTAKLHLDVVTARQETYSHPGALPEVSPGDLQQDLARRDFSINAMAISLTENRWGELVDPLGGQADLAAKHVRMLHDKSFMDDPTRMLRALRYAVRLGFSLDESTGIALHQCIAFIEKVSGVRRWNEIERILHEPEPEVVLGWAYKTGLLGRVDPALRSSARQQSAFVEARNRRGAGIDPLVGVGLLVFEALPNERSRLAADLHLPRAEQRVIAELNELNPLRRLSDPAMAPSAVAEALDGTSPAVIEAAGLMIQLPQVRERLFTYLAEWRSVRPRLTAKALEEMGVPHGPAIGHYLHRLRAARVDGITAAPEDERRLVAEWLREGA